MGSWLGLECPSLRAVGSGGSTGISESWTGGEKGQRWASCGWVLRVEMGTGEEGQ